MNGINTGAGTVCGTTIGIEEEEAIGNVIGIGIDNVAVVDDDKGIAIPLVVDGIIVVGNDGGGGNDAARDCW